MADTLPPLPDGFTLDAPRPAMPPLPEGFTLDAPAPRTFKDRPPPTVVTGAPERTTMDGVKNLAAGMGERIADVVGGGVRTLGHGAEALIDAGTLAAQKQAKVDAEMDAAIARGDPMTPAMWLRKQGLTGARKTVNTDAMLAATPEQIAAPSSVLKSFEANADDLQAISLGYEQMTSWEDFKSSPVRNFVPFALETGLVSAPDMAAAMVALPAYVAARTGELAGDRAANNNIETASVGDLLATLPAATVSALLDRFGGRGMFGLDEAAVQTLKQVPKEIGKAAVKEGATEAAQEGVEYLGTNLGTETGVDPAEIGERALAATVGGAGFGGAVRTGTAAADYTGNKIFGTPQAEPVVTPAAEAEDGLPPLPEGFALDGEPDAVERAPGVAPAEPGRAESAPIADQPSPASDPRVRATLRKMGWTDTDIDSMSPEEAAGEAGQALGPPTADDIESAARYGALPETPANAEAPAQVPDAIDISGEMQEAFNEEARLSSRRGLPTDGNRSRPAEIERAQDLDVVGQRVDTEPSEAMAKAGNYKKGHARVAGLNVTIENPKGSIRRGKTPEGEDWEAPVSGHYGYVKRTKGADGDHVDIILGDNPKSKKVYIVDQKGPGAKSGFDEHKLVGAVDSIAEARDLYVRMFNDGTGNARLGAITAISPKALKDWLATPSATRTSYAMGKINKTPEGWPADTRGKVKRPPSLSEFLAANGGVRDQKGELANMDAGRVFIPGTGKLLRPNGRTLDQARALAVENGYLQDAAEGEQSTSTINDLLEALRADLGGERVFSRLDDDWVGAWNDERSRDEGERRGAEARDRAISELRELDIDPDADGMAEVIDLMMEGMDAGDALERAAMKHDAKHRLPPEATPYLPFFDEAPHEVQPGAASPDRQSPRAGGEEGARPEEGSDVEAVGQPAPAGGEGGPEVDGEADGGRGDQEGAAVSARDPFDSAFDEALDETFPELPQGQWPHETMPAAKIFPAPAETVSTRAAKDYISQEEADARIAEWKAIAKRVGQQNDNSGKVIISLFDYTGSWSQPWRDAGFTVIQQDIQHAKGADDYQTGDEKYHDVLERMPLPDISEVKDAGGEIYGVLAATPCTTFAASGARWWEGLHDVNSREAVEKVFGPWVPEGFDSPLDFNKTLVAATEMVIEFANPTHFHVMENPVGRIASEMDLPKPTMRFDPNNFGDPYTKHTQLWGTFETDLPTANTAASEGSKMQSKLGSKDKVERSKTPDGFAYAFFIANAPKDQIAAASPTVEAGAEGKPQTVIPGTERISDAEQAQRGADKPLKAKKPQKDVGGLFGDDKDQTDLVDRAREAGARIEARKKQAKELSARDAVRMVKGDQKALTGKDASEPGKYRLTRFDDDGPIGHTVYSTHEEAILDALREGYKPEEPTVKSAATKAAMGLDEITRGLSELFGGAKVSSGLSFDDETYRKALPFFRAGVAHFKDAATELSEVVKHLVRYLAQNGMDREAIDRMRPYVRRFVEDEAKAKPPAEHPGLVIKSLETGKETTIQPPGTVKPAEPATKTTEKINTPAPTGSLVEELRDFLLSPDNRFETINQARKWLMEHGWKATREEVANKEAEEVIEHAIVLAARDIITGGQKRGSEVIYDRLVSLYERQPRLATRTSQSLAEQAYSTPMPLAYVVDRLANIRGGKVIYEPTAGNGALLIDANPNTQDVHANELNPDRAKALRAQGFTATTQDAMKVETPAGTDRIVANPPFGAVREAGVSTIYEIGEHRTTAIDQAIALKALAGMEPHGKAVLIVGSVKDGTEAERSDNYNTSQKRKFYKRLYDNYNVVEHFTVSGSLYARQGAQWPVDVIVIDGKGKSSRPLPAARVPSYINSWASLKGYLDGSRGEEVAGDGTRPLPVATGEEIQRPVGGIERPEGGVIGGGKPADVSRPVVSDARPGGQPTPASVPDDRGQRGPDGKLDGDQGPAPVGVGVEPARVRGVTPAKSRDARVAGEANAAGQVPYRPYSREGQPLNTLVPQALGASMDASLARIEQKHGDIDGYVADALGVKLSDIKGTADKPGMFSAEQVDAIALAIDNVENGEAFIIGDQTGIGKGRVVAAAIAYAHKRGMTPLFVTEKPDLYGDMYRDLSDIRWKDMLGRDPVIFMTNANTVVPLDDAAVDWIIDRDAAKAEGRKAPPKTGQFTKSESPAEIEKKMLDVLSGKYKPDAIFTTYDQTNTLSGSETARRRFMDLVMPRAFLIMDESHNAGGQGPKGKQRLKKDAPPPRSAKFRDWVQAARAVMYSSATYAKNPAVMDLYSRTDMVKAVDDPADLPELIAKGKVPLQQVVASMLADAGQYARRERSFAGIEYAMETAAVDQDNYAAFSESMRTIFEFDRAIKDFRKDWISAWLKENGAAQGMDSGIGDLAANATEFSSIMHNLTNQMLLAIKADAAADAAIAAWKAGEKPVVTLSFTNESFLTDFARDNDIEIGGEVGINFKDMVRRYLDRTLRITVKTSDDEKFHVFIPPDELDQFRSLYDLAQETVEAADFGTLKVSPIDWMRQRMKDAGMKVAEITGRGTVIDYSKKTPLLASRDTKEMGAAGKRVSIKKFNDGQLDAMILNKSGSTGVSLHSSSKYKDQRKRRMVILQADGNIDTHMQTLGRINRTGQVVLPVYTQLVADIPAEARPAAVLMKKMASLSANTTASRKSAMTSEEAVDFLNEYGDLAAVQFVRDNPLMNIRLGTPIAFSDKGAVTTENPAQKLTGRLVLLKPDEQEELLEELTTAYKAILAQKEAIGENALEAKALDLRAESVSKVEIKPAIGPGPFEAAAHMEEMMVKAPGLSMKPRDVVDKVADALENRPSTWDFTRALLDMQRLGRDKNGRMVDIMRTEHDQWAKWAIDGIKDTEAKNNQRAKANAQWDKWVSIMRMAPIGQHVVMEGEGGGDMPAIVTDIRPKRGKKAKSPTALSGWVVELALPDSSRSLTVPFSQIALQKTEGEDATVIRAAGYGERLNDLEKQFEAAASEGKTRRYIATGNLLAAFDGLEKKGQIIQFTDKDGNVKPGIIMPRSFDLAGWQADRRIKFQNADQAMRFLAEAEVKAMENDKGGISITNTYKGYEFSVSKKRKAAVTDSTVRAVYDLWQDKYGQMVATVDAATAKKIIAAMQAAGVKFVAPSEPELAQSIVYPKRAAQVQAQLMAQPTEKAPTGWETAGEYDVPTLTREEMQEVANIIYRVSGKEETKFEAALILPSDGDAMQQWGEARPGTSEAAGLYSTRHDNNMKFVSDVITISMRAPSGGRQTAYHEAFHRVQTLFLNEQERRLLASEKEYLMALVRLKRMSPERMSQKELEAEAFAIYSDIMDRGGGEGVKLHIGLRRAWARLMLMLRAVRNYLNGKGYQTVTSIFDAARAGKMKERPEGTAPASGATYYQPAWHGTPHKWEGKKADLGKIGSGEGAQSYGWGLYFASRRGVAEHYRNKLARNKRGYLTLDGKRINTKLRAELQNSTDPYVREFWNSRETVDALRQMMLKPSIERRIFDTKDQIADLEKRIADYIARPPVASTYTPKDYRERIEGLQRRVARLEAILPRVGYVEGEKGGALYKVEVPDDHEMMVWDAPLSEQPEGVREKLKTIGTLRTNMSGEGFYRELVDVRGSPQAASEALREAGIPGHKYLDGGSRAAGDGSYNYVIYDDSRVSVLEQYQLMEGTAERVPAKAKPEQAVSALVTQRISRTLRSSVAGLKGLNKQERSHRDDGESAGDYLTRKVIDYLHPLRMMQERGGYKLTQLNNAYLNARLAEDRALAQIQRMHDTYIAPMVKALADGGASLEELHRYLYALHAEERNRVVGLRHPRDSQMFKAIEDHSLEGASGWSVNKVRETIAEFRGQPEKHRALRIAAGAVREMIDAELNNQRRAGLISEETHELLTTQWKNYVPLKGMDGMTEEGFWKPGGAGGFDVRGDEFKTALGRFSEAENVIAHAITQGEQSILRQHKNDVGKAMARFINEFDPEGEHIAQVYWSGDDKFLGDITKATDVYKRIIGKDGLVSYRRVPNPFSNLDDVLAAKVGGRTFYIRFRDPKIGLALRKLGTAELGMISKIVRPLTIWQSIVNTRANPAFTPINIIRDAQAGATHLLDEGFSVKQVAGIMANIPKAMQSLWRVSRKKDGDAEWDKHAREYIAAGGKITFHGYSDLEDNLKKLQKQVIEASKGISPPKAAWRAVTKFVGDLNDAGENGIRLAAYVAARQIQGKPEKEAAFMARDLTVDFKKHGEIGPAMNSWFVFFNAAAQGAYNVAARTARSKAVRAAVATFIFGGMMQHVWNSLFAGDDDDGENYYKKMLLNEPWKLERQIVLFIPGTEKYISFPMPYGYNAFHHLGLQGAAMMGGDQSPVVGLLSILRVGFDAFNPIGSGSMASMLTPTIADPAVDIIANQNVFGSPIYPSGNPFDRSPPPESQQAFTNTSDYARWTAEALNWMSGGDEVLPGAIDIHPDTIEHLWGYLVGGLGRFGSNIVDTATNTVQGEIEPAKMPYVRNFYGEIDENSQRTEYYRERERILAVEGYHKQYNETGETDTAKAYREDNAAEFKALGAFKSAEKTRRDINKERRRIAGDDKMTAAKRDALLEKLDKRELDAMRSARAAYVKALGQ